MCYNKVTKPMQQGGIPMESIVTQIVVKMVEEILKNFKENGFSDICTDSTRLMSIVNSNV